MSSTTTPTLRKLLSGIIFSSENRTTEQRRVPKWDISSTLLCFLQSHQQRFFVFSLVAISIAMPELLHFSTGCQQFVERALSLNCAIFEDEDVISTTERGPAM